MNAAACNDKHICIVADIKIVINKVGHTRFCYDNGTVNAFVFCAGGNDNIYAGLVFFINNFNVCR